MIYDKLVFSVSLSMGSARFYYASNVCDNLVELKKLLIYAVKKKVDFVLLTNVVTPQLSYAERESYQHAMHFVQEGFQAQNEFVDIQQFIRTYKKDTSGHIYSKSSQQILKIIEQAHYRMQLQTAKTARLLKASEVPVVIVPGQTENVDLILDICEELKPFYLNMKIREINSVKVLGIGGCQVVDDSVPQVLQDNEYFEGGLDGAEMVRELVSQEVDVFVSFAPVRFKTEAGEEEKIRPLVNEYLPGKLILTSQALYKNFNESEILATGSLLIRGGFFGDEKNNNNPGVFWDIALEGPEVFCQANQLRGDTVYNLSEKLVELDPQIERVKEDTILPDDENVFYQPKKEEKGENIYNEVKTALMDISLED